MTTCYLDFAVVAVVVVAVVVVLTFFNQTHLYLYLYFLIYIFQVLLRIDLYVDHRSEGVST